MISPSIILLTAGVLVLASVLASRISDRFGVPVLLLFLGIGMLAGSDGPGGIRFDNVWAANVVGTFALAFILFAGGLDTNWRIIRPVAARGAVLSTLGVTMTALLVGLFSWGVIGFNLSMGLLVGAIISSTDAAAVFAILRARGVGLRGNLKPLLELESGSNDPMAIFLTMGMTQVLTVPGFGWPQLLPAFLLNMSCGVVMGLASGKIAGALFNRIHLDNEGLYPILSMSLVVLTFGTTEFWGGNGFLAVYLCGILMNGSDFAHKRAVTRFHDGLAWLMQILLFLALGLLVSPSQLPAIALEALAIVAFLMLVARPAAVAIGLWGSAFSRREQALVAWTGLRGAVPIVLATVPLTAGYENSNTVFNVVFFTVLTSVLIQGTLLMPVARWLKVDEPMASRPRFSIAIERAGQAQGETREVEIQPNMAAVGRAISDLGIPPDVLILLIGRGDGSVVPRGNTRIEPYDTLLLLGSPAALRKAEAAVLSPPKRAREMEALDDPLATLPMSTEEKYLAKQVVVVGYGRVGRRVCDTLEARSVPFVVADQNREIVEQLRARNIPAVAGDASDPLVLTQAHIARAAILVIATPDTLKAGKMIEIAQTLNPGIETMVRTQSEMEANLLDKGQKGRVFLAEHELADNIVRHVLSRMIDRRAAQEEDSKTG